MGGSLNSTRGLFNSSKFRVVIRHFIIKFSQSLFWSKNSVSKANWTDLQPCLPLNLLIGRPRQSCGNRVYFRHLHYYGLHYDGYFRRYRKVLLWRSTIRLKVSFRTKNIFFFMISPVSLVLNKASPISTPLQADRTLFNRCLFTT